MYSSEQQEFLLSRGRKNPDEVSQSKPGVCLSESDSAVQKFPSPDTLFCDVMNILTVGITLSAGRSVHEAGGILSDSADRKWELRQQVLRLWWGSDPAQELSPGHTHSTVPR